MMKILVISQPAWSNENNSGNTLSNVFKGFDAEFANIYFSEGLPNNDICKLYFQVTDYQILQHFLKRKPVGRAVAKLDAVESSGEAFESSAKKHKNAFLLLMRELLWKMAKIETDEMMQFIKHFNPDVIYAPSYGNLHMQRIVSNIHRMTGLPVISLISDDLYHYHAEDRSLFGWINKTMLRKSMHKTFSIYSLIYTMTDEQRTEYEGIFHVSMKIMRKNAAAAYKTHSFKSPYHMIYAGGLYLGRLKTIEMIAEEISKMNSDKSTVIFDIYSNTALTSEERTRLQTNNGVSMHSSVPYDELIQKYRESDIALHAESFESRYSDYTRLSFSTKIVDCLQSGAAVLAVGPKNNAGITYLEREKAAVCCTDANDIGSSMKALIDDLPYWQRQAELCIQRNHNPAVNKQQMELDFHNVINSSKRSAQ